MSRVAQSRRPEFVISDLLLRTSSLHARLIMEVASLRRNAGEHPKWLQGLSGSSD